MTGQLFDSTTGTVIAETSNVRGLYSLNLEIPVIQLLSQTVENSTELWHHRLGHIPYDRLKLLEAQLQIKLPEKELTTCSICNVTKITRGVNYIPKTRATDIGDKIYRDLVGPINPQGINSHRYFLLFTDDRTRDRWIYMLRKKNKAFRALQQHYELIQTQTGRGIKSYSLDRDTELANQ